MNLLHFGSISHLHHLLPRSDFINCDLFNLSINAFFLIKPIVILILCSYCNFSSCVPIVISHLVFLL